MMIVHKNQFEKNVSELAKQFDENEEMFEISNNDFIEELKTEIFMLVQSQRWRQFIYYFKNIG